MFVHCGGTACRLVDTGQVREAARKKRSSKEESTEIDRTNINTNEDENRLILAKHRAKSSSNDSSLELFLQHKVVTTATRMEQLLGC